MKKNLVFIIAIVVFILALIFTSMEFSTVNTNYDNLWFTNGDGSRIFYLDFTSNNFGVPGAEVFSNLSFTFNTISDVCGSWPGDMTVLTSRSGF